MLNTESCKGCLLKQDDHYYRCIINKFKKHSDIIIKCPCSNCLIKGMCQDYCKLFIDYMLNDAYKLFNIPKGYKPTIDMIGKGLTRGGILMIFQIRLKMMKLRIDDKIKREYSDLCRMKQVDEFESVDSYAFKDTLLLIQYYKKYENSLIDYNTFI